MRILKAHIDDFDESFYLDAFRLLSKDRQHKALRYQNETDRRSCILGDFLLRKAIAEDLNCNMNEVSIHHTESGKPYIAHPDNSDLHISLSHSGGFVVIALDNSAVGIDVEMTRKIDDAVVSHALSQDESDYVGTSQHRFFEVWTMKESYLKCTGTGISGCKRLNHISVFRLPNGYKVKEIESTNDYVISVCMATSNQNCKFNDSEMQPQTTPEI